MKNKRPKAAVKNSPVCSEPTPYDLAMLAAALSQESTLDKLVFAIRNQGTAWSVPDHLAEFWVKQALALWLTADGVLKKWRTTPADVFPKPAPTPPPEPEPNRYPVTLDEFLRLMLPNLSGRTGEKYHHFREYLAFRLRHHTPAAMTWAHDCIPPGAIPFDCLCPQIVPQIPDDFSYSSHKPRPTEPPEPPKDDVDRYVTLWNTKGIPDRGSFLYHAKWFREWYQPVHAAQIRKARRDAGAKGRASPKRPKNKPKEEG